MFYYNVKFANGESLVILSAGDPVDEIPAEFQGDVANVETICEVSGDRQLADSLVHVPQLATDTSTIFFTDEEV